MTVFLPIVLSEYILVVGIVDEIFEVPKEGVLVTVPSVRLELGQGLRAGWPVAVVGPSCVRGDRAASVAATVA